MTPQDLHAALRRALELPDDYPMQGDTAIGRIPGWDSLGWVAVIAAIEDHTGREFQFENIERLATLDDLLAAVNDAGAPNHT